MQGLMQSYPLTLVHPFERAERLFADKPIVSATPTGSERTTYGEWAERTRRLGGVLDALGRLRGRPRRHVRVELRAPPRALLRRPVLRARAAHAQHPALPGAAPVRRRPRAGRGDLRRPLAAEAAVAADRRAADRQARRGHGRRRRRRDPRRRAHPRLRDAARRGRAGRVPRLRREQRRGHVLHERHHRQPEGRRLLAPLERPALHELDVRRHARASPRRT